LVGTDLRAVRQAYCGGSRAGCTSERLQATRLALQIRQGDPAIPVPRTWRPQLKCSAFQKKYHYTVAEGVQDPNSPTSLDLCTARRLSSSRKDYRERKTHPAF